MMGSLLSKLHSGAGPNFSRLSRESVRVGHHELTYSTPGNEGREGVESVEPRALINLQDKLTTGQWVTDWNQCLIIVNALLWDYRGLKIQGYFGHLATLHLVVKLVKSNRKACINEADLASVRNYIEVDARHFFEEMDVDESSGAGLNTLLRKEHEQVYGSVGEPHLVRLPNSFQVSDINGALWLRYEKGGENVIGQKLCWTYPISSDYLIEFEFGLNPEIGKKHLRLQRMREDAERIMSSVTISRVSQ